MQCVHCLLHAQLAKQWQQCFSLNRLLLEVLLAWNGPSEEKWVAWVLSIVLS